MNKRFSWIFLLASGAFFVFIVGLTGYRIEDAPPPQRRRRSASMPHRLRRRFARCAISPAASSHRCSRPTCATSSTVSRGSCCSPCIPRRTAWSTSSRGTATSLKEPAQITPEWRGTPVVPGERGSEILVSSALGSDMPGVTMDAIFVIMGKEDLYPVVRDDLYFFLAFLLVCGVAILIVMSVETDTEQRPRRAPSYPSGMPAGRRVQPAAGGRPGGPRRPSPSLHRRPSEPGGPSPHLAPHGARLGGVPRAEAEGGARACRGLGPGSVTRAPQDR